MMKQKTKWVLVADGARARIFVKNSQGIESATSQDFVAENLKESDLGTAKPGRTFESSNSARHAYASHTDWHQNQKNLFAKELCNILEKATEKKEFDELILVAPSKSLGELRAHLNKQTALKVTAEIPKDVTKFTEPELMSFLERELD
jgi:protein required for attachment to host cells